MKVLLFLVLLEAVFVNCRVPRSSHEDTGTVTSATILTELTTVMPPSFNISCNECNSYVEEIIKIIKDKKQMEDIKFIMKRIAKDMGEDVDNLLDHAMEALPTVLAQLKKDPQLPCKIVGFCGNNRRAAMAQLRKLMTPYLKEQYIKQGKTCDQCMDSVKQKKEKLPSLKNAQEKILVLAKYSICREYGEDCMNFLKEFLNDVYAEMEEFLNDNQKYCTSLKTCA